MGGRLAELVNFDDYLEVKSYGKSVFGLPGSGSNKAAFDKQTLKVIDEMEELKPSVKDKLIFLANAIIRDAKTGMAYAH